MTSRNQVGTQRDDALIMAISKEKWPYIIDVKNLLIFKRISPKGLTPPRPPTPCELKR